MEFRDNRDAEDAMYALDRSTIGGREISVSIMLGIPTAVRPPPPIPCDSKCRRAQVVLSKEARKTPREMLRREGQEDGGRGGASRGYGSGGGGGGDRRSDRDGGYRDKGERGAPSSPP